ncbi:MAG: hypothetical protein CVV03_01305 [Firmicutes bacterium HGW-Firmicutes-8]|nr:MAG: hypothetical protein CVV03_01305 [Firmicutes bacterium HGW-Firmicutes-8]
MTKFVDKRVEVRCDGKNAPLAFRWNGRWAPVNRILEIWKDTGAWWDGEAEKTFYRLETSAGGLYELYLDNADQTWFLYRIYD